MPGGPERIELQGFNNLSKTLSCNLYGFFFARDEEERHRFVRDIDARYCSDRIASILQRIATFIDAEVLSVSARDYAPHGASSLVLIGEEPSPGATGATVGAHLDKSHVCAHTYPDWTSPSGVCTFRIDVEVATCGVVVPVRALDLILEHFEADVAVIDYTVRGFTRDVEGRRVYCDHDVGSLCDHIAPALRDRYRHQDLALPGENIWQTRLCRRELRASDYLAEDVDPASEQARAGLEWVRREMAGIYGRRP